MDNGITPVIPMGSDGFEGGAGFMWIFGLLILLGMFNGGFGYGGNGNTNALQADVNRGFDNQNLQAQSRDILAAVSAGTAQSVAATNQTFHDSLAAMQGLYNETSRDIAALAVGQANLAAAQAACCCETKQMIMQNNYDSALRDAATNAAFTAQIQSVKDMISQNKIESLQAEIGKLQLAQATAGVLRFPMGWSYEAGPFPPIFSSTSSGTTTA